MRFAKGARYTLAGFLLCNAGCAAAGLKRWWAARRG